MLRATILSRKEVQDVLVHEAINGCGDVDAVISLNDPEMSEPVSVRVFTKPKLILNFDDITHNFAMFTGRRVPEDNTAPNEENIRQIIEFAQANSTVQHLLSHCHAGISRSSAAAIIFAAANGEDVFKLVHAMMHDRPIIYPNRLMLDIAAGLLGKSDFIEDTNMAFLQSPHPFHDRWGDDRSGFDRWGIS